MHEEKTTHKVMNQKVQHANTILFKKFLPWCVVCGNSYENIVALAMAS